MSGLSLQVTDSKIGEFIVVALKLGVNPLCLDNVKGDIFSRNKIKIYQTRPRECEDVLP